jgi:hypothetical protein
VHGGVLCALLTVALAMPGLAIASHSSRKKDRRTHITGSSPAIARIASVLASVTVSGMIAER